MNGSDDTASLPSGLPPGSTIQRVMFASQRVAGQAVIFEFPSPVNRLAVLATGGRGEVKPPQVHDDLVLLSVAVATVDDPEVLTRARDWVDATTRGSASQVLALQGTQVVWAPGAAAVLAPTDRIDAVRKAVVEAAYYDAELRAIELELGGLWPEMEADLPLAFEFNERSVRGRRQLAERFKRVLALRARLARIAPHVLCPHIHPPTLASQVGERLRERGRMAHRVESVGGQVEVFERVYEGCGQRASDFMLARTGHTLEWVIIALLLAQTLLVGFDLLTARAR